MTSLRLAAAAAALVATGLALPSPARAAGEVLLKIEGNRVTDQERLTLHKRIRDVAQAPDGSVWVMTDGKDGELLRLTPASK